MKQQGPRAARPSDVGRLAHRAIADVVVAIQELPTGRPAWRDVLDIVDARLRHDGYRDRAARQLVTVSVLGYLRHLPDESWEFLRSELPLPGARLDLVWRHRTTGELLVDEVKTGYGGPGTRSVGEQVARYAGLLSASGQPASVRVVATRWPETHPAGSPDLRVQFACLRAHTARPPPCSDR